MCETSERLFVGRCADCKKVCQIDKCVTWFDYSGMNTVRLARCPFCNEKVILEYIEEPDRESWYY